MEKHKVKPDSKAFHLVSPRSYGIRQLQVIYKIQTYYFDKSSTRGMQPYFEIMMFCL